MNEKILIIDDDPDNLMTLETILKKERYQIRSTSDGKKAMGLIESEPFDLVIMDIRTTGLNGVETISQIKGLGDNIEVIVLTGSASIENAVKSLRDHGASDFLTKPLENADQLINTVKRALQKHELNQGKRLLFEKVQKITEELHKILSRLSDSWSK